MNKTLQLHEGTQKVHIISIFQKNTTFFFQPYFFCPVVQNLKGVGGQHQQDAAATGRHTESSHYS